MRKIVIAVAALGALLVLLFAALAVVRRIRQQGVEMPPEPAFEAASSTVGEAEETAAEALPEARQALLYGRVTAADGVTYEGRLRFRGDEEAYWDDYYIGFKDENAWAALVAPGKLPRKRVPIEFLGLAIAHREKKLELGRPFMRRFGEIARLERQDRDILVTLKSGAVVALDRFSYGDWDDGVRVWDAGRGVVDLDPGAIRAIEFLPTGPVGSVPRRLHGTVRTPGGDFSGFLQWNRRFGVGSDRIAGRTGEGVTRIRLDAVRSIAPRSDTSFLVTLLDGREVLLTDTETVDQRHQGTYVDDPRYGRVLFAHDAFERVDFDPVGEPGGGGAGGSGRAYGDFPPGRPLTGSVVAGGRRLAGRLVFDLDESETTETLDAPSSRGIDYTIPFGIVTAIVPSPGDARWAEPVTVTLASGEELRLQASGDLGEENAGMLVFADGAERPEYVPWSEVERIDLDRLPEVSLPGGTP